MTAKTKYTAVVSFVIDIEAIDSDVARHIADNAIPTHYGFSTTEGGSGNFKKALDPLIMVAGGKV